MEYLPEFGGAYLEDSYFLGITAEGKSLRLRVLFALTIDHVAYSPPKPGEAHCYRTGSLLIEEPSIDVWKRGEQSVLRDPDRTIDFGSIELYRNGTSNFRVVTEWLGRVRRDRSA